MNLAAIALDALIILGATIVLMLLLGALSRRLLGVRISGGRILLAGVFGVGAGLGFESQFVWKAASYTPAVLPILFGVIFFVAMAVLVIAELLVPQGSLPRPDQWVPLTRRAFARNRRYLQMLRIAARHRLFAIKLGPAAQEIPASERRRQATALKLALEEAGGAFVKIGQLLSTRPDVLPSEFLDVLGTLQQKVAPVPWDHIEPALDKSLGHPHLEAFTSFEHEPFAAASIGQVHNAVLQSGERVAVKVRRPGIVTLIERDIDIAERWARHFARTSDWAAQFGVEHLVESLTESLREELDYELEASNMAALAAAQRQIPKESRVRIPHYHPEFSSGDVLVMEYITGSTLSNPDTLQALGPLTRRKLAERLLSATLAQIMEAGVFHSDLHPGNIIVTGTGDLVLLDFGSIGRIDSETRARLGEVLLAFSRRDAAGFTDALVEFVDLTDGQDEQGLRRTISNFMSRRLGPGARLDAATFGEVVSILSAYGLTVPPEVTVPFHTIATVEGSLNVLDPTFDLVDEAGSYAQRRISEASHPFTMAQTLSKELISALPLVKRMPHRVDRITGHLADGRFSMNMRLVADVRDRNFFREIIGLGVVAFLAGIFGVMGAMLLASVNGPQLTDTLTLFQVFGYLFLLVSGVLTLRALFDVLRRRSLRSS